MSAMIKTVTPFLNEKILLEAIEGMGHEYKLSGNRILLPFLENHYGIAYFSKDHLGKFSLNGDIHYGYRDKIDKIYKKLINELGIKYNEIYQRIENEKLEAERREYIKKQRAEIIRRAEEQGYAVTEKNRNGKIKLQLVRRSY